MKLLWKMLSAHDSTVKHAFLFLPKDYVFAEGDLVFPPGEKKKEVQVKLLELTEIDALLHNKQLKQFAVDLINPRFGAKVGKYPQTMVTIVDPGEPHPFLFNRKPHFDLCMSACCRYIVWPFRHLYRH